MLRQTISVTSKALRGTARLGVQRQTAAFAQRTQTPLVAAQTIAPRARWYSSEADAAAKKTEEGEKKEAEAEGPEAALKKQLEAKDAEIRDLKVRLPATPPAPTPPCCSSMLMRNPPRTATSAPSPTSATCRTAPPAR